MWLTKNHDSKSDCEVNAAPFLNMVPRGPPGPPGAFSLVLLAATWLSMVCADLARIYPMSVTEWQFDSKLQLSITSEGSAIPVRYTVIPLTSDLGLNGSPANRRVSSNFFTLWRLERSVGYLAAQSTSTCYSIR